MKLLMHMCCAPCSVFPTSLMKGDIELEGLFYNPNIHPAEEHKRRKENVELFSKLENIPVTCMDDFMQDEWEAFKGHEDMRCKMCYGIRMDKVAQYAKEMGFDAFTTSLLVSPYQKHDVIKNLGQKAAEKYGIDFYYKDFRPGFRQGQQMAKEMGLYRQKFCGCIVSYNESQNRKK
ncbi:MAG: epoxyqueuosine reductase QueH [Clostridia bacterium]|nr:epoxyqueuosine reductase QueH [Clostridia bacterium]